MFEKNFSSVTCVRLIYSFINYLGNTIPYDFDISSYWYNKNSNNTSDVNFINTNLSKLIFQNSKFILKNRLFLVISINDLKLNSISKSQKLLKGVFENIEKTFWQSDLLDLLELYEPETKIKFITKNIGNKFENNIVILLCLPDYSTIEIIISTHNLNSNIIERDNDGDVIEYNGKLHFNIANFEKERKN